MLQISLPQQLFAGQKLYSISRNVDKPAGLSNASYRLAVILPQAPVNLPAQQKEMLEKLVKACKFNEAEVVYKDASAGGALFAEICAQYHPQTVLYFGEILISRNLTGLKKNCTYEFNGVKLLMAQSPEQIHKSAVEKKALWESLQKLLAIG